MREKGKFVWKLGTRERWLRRGGEDGVLRAGAASGRAPAPGETEALGSGSGARTKQDAPSERPRRARLTSISLALLGAEAGRGRDACKGLSSLAGLRQER